MNEPDELCRALVEALPDAVWVNLNTTIVFANPACLKLLNAQRAEQVLGQSIFDFVHPDDHALVRERIQQVLAQGEPVPPLEEKVLRLDGSVLEVECIATPLLYQNNPAILMVLHNIAERKRAEEAWRKSKALLAVAQRQARLGSWEFDPARQMGTWSAEMYGLFEREPALGPPSAAEFLEFIHAEDRERIVAANERALYTGELQAVEFRSNPQRGPLRYFSGTVQGLKDTAGQVVQLTGTVLDITERKRAEQGLRESEERFSKVFYQSPIGIALTDLTDNTIRDVNDALLKMIGSTREQIVGQNALLLNIEVDSDVRAEIKRELQERGKFRNKEVQLRLPSGETRDVLNSGVLINLGGRPHNLGLLEDITERKRAEAALRRRADELATLYATSLDLIAPHDLPALLGAIVERAAQLLDSPSGGLYLCEPERQEVRCVVNYKTLHDYTGVVLKYGEGVAGQVAQTGQPLMVEDYRIWPGRSARYEADQPFVAVLGAPMLWRGAVSGVILVDDTRPRHFTTAHQELLALFANHAAMAVENARLLETERAARELAETIRAANLALSQSLDLDTVLKALLDHLSQLMPYDSANVMLLESETRFRVRALRGYERFAANLDLIRGTTFDGQANRVTRPLLEKQSVVIADSRETPGWEVRPGGEHVRSWLGIPLVSGGRMLGHFSVDKVEPGFFTAEHVRRAELLAAPAATAIYNAQLLQQTQQRVTELAAIYDASQRLLQLHTPQTLATEIIHVLEVTLGYEFGAVLLIDELTGRLSPYALSDQGRGLDFVEMDKANVASRGPALGRGITGWVAQAGESVRMGDVRQDPRYLAVRDDIRSELCVPLRTEERVIGVVNVETTQLDAYTESDQRVLETVAAQIGIAIQNARLLQSVREQAEQLRALSTRLAEVEEAERRELTRELHDRVGQSLTALNLNLTLMQSQLLPGSAQKIGLRLDDSLALVAETMRQVRNVMGELRPPALDDYGLAAALRLYAEQVSQRTGLRLSVSGDDLGTRLPPAAEMMFFRVAQEALTNTLKHARATQATLTLTEAEDRVRLTLADDGVGFDPAALTPAGPHWGLITIQERALALGGQVRLESAPGQGTRLSVEIERR